MTNPRQRQASSGSEPRGRLRAERTPTHSRHLRALRWLWVGCLGGTLAWATHAGAQASAAPGAWRSADRETARALVQVGDKELAAKNYGNALDAYIKADRIMGVPSTSYPVAHLQVLLGRLNDARQTCTRIGQFVLASDDPPEFATAKNEALRLLEELATRIPVLRIVVHGVSETEPLEVKIDDKRVGRQAASRGLPLDPGVYVVSASAPGYSAGRQTVTIKEAEAPVVELRLARTEPGATEHSGPTLRDASPAGPSAEPAGEPIATPAPAASESALYPLSPLSLAGFVVGAVGIIGGAIVGGLAISVASDVKDLCAADDSCEPQAQADIDRGTVLAHVSTTSFAVGAAGAAVGLVTLLVTLQQNESVDADGAAQGLSGWAAVVPVVGPGVVGVMGRF